MKNFWLKNVYLFIHVIYRRLQLLVKKYTNSNQQRNTFMS